VSDLRAVNARLRELVLGKDELITSLNALVRGQAEQLANQAKQIDTQRALIEAQRRLIEADHGEVAGLPRRLSADSSSSSRPPSSDRP
jgi:hypothetical protein